MGPLEESYSCVTDSVGLNLRARSFNMTRMDSREVLSAFHYGLKYLIGVMAL